LILLALLAALGAGTALPAAARADDTSPPQITAFSISPAVVDTESAPQTLTLTMTLTDDQSGVALWNDPDIQLGLVCCGAMRAWDGTGYSGTQSTTLSPQRISGTALDGEYTATVTLPAGAQPGDWRVCWLQLSDKVGNTTTLSTEDLETLFGAGCATVTNTAKTADTTPPRVTAFRLDPPTIDTGTGPQTVTATVSIADDQSGVATSGDMGFGSEACALDIRPLTTWQVAFNSLTRQSGDDHNGVYTVSLTLPFAAHNGIWQADLGLADKAGNSVQLNASEVEAQLGAGCAQVDNVAQISDEAPPKVTELSVSPAEVNTEDGEQTVGITMRMTDDLSGVSAFNDQGRDVVRVELRPLIGSQVVSGYVSRDSGTDRDGVYSAAVTLPHSAKEGLWKVERILSCDKVGNVVWLSADDLHAAVPDADLFFANTAQAKQVTIENDWTLSGSDASVTFPAGTVVTRLDGGRFAFYQMTAAPFALDDGIPTQGLDGTPVACLRVGIPGLNLSFDRPVTISLQVGAQYDGTQLQIQSLTETGQAWTDETTCEVVDGRCSFAVDHATRFAAVALAPLPDTTPPVVSVSGVAPGWANHNQTLTLSAVDAVAPGHLASGVAAIQYSLTGSAPWKRYVTPLAFSAQGDTRVTYRAVDNAGNTSAPATTHVLIDKSAPVTSVSGVPADWSKTASIALQGKDALSGVSSTEYRLQGATAWSLYAGPFEPRQGASVYEYRSTDRAGNVEAARTFSVKYDSGTPVPTALADATVKVGGTASLQYRVNDISPRVTVVIRVFRGADLMKTIDVGAVASNKDLACTYRCTLPKGTYAWKVYAEDLAGNAQATPGARTLTVK
jgi:hypothetical protein